MKRNLALTVLILAFNGALMAHPPSEINLKFDPVKRVLEVTVMHDVKDSTKHFIEEITVKINGEDAVKQTLHQQTDNREQKASYVLIDAKPGDEISVKAECNMFGDKKQTLQIPKP